MPARRILLAAPISPPATLSAAHRIAGMARYLGEAGHDVTVLTSMVSGSGPVPGAARTVRTRDLMVSRLNWRRANFEAVAGNREGGYDATPSAFASVLVPDLEVVGWLPFALPAALRLARRGGFDCVITSSPPHSGHALGLALQARGLPWVADFRDGWRFEPTRPRFPLAVQRGLDARMERVVARRADAVVGVTAPITGDLRDRLGADAVTITNGFDPREAAAADWEPPLSADRHSLVYTGSLSYAGNSPEPLLRALDVLEPAVAARLELVVAGPVTGAEREELGRRFERVQLLGRLPRDRTLALQRAADSLLLIAGDHRPSVATGKLYEYLATDRPILVLGRRSVAARIVEETRAGLVAAVDDPAGIAAALAQLAGGYGRDGDRRAIAERFSYPALAAAMAEQVERAIARRRAA
jgi:glycosyltransferase involved in cell wall biosynthesis